MIFTIYEPETPEAESGVIVKSGEMTQENALLQVRTGQKLLQLSEFPGPDMCVINGQVAPLKPMSLPDQADLDAGVDYVWVIPVGSVVTIDGGTEQRADDDTLELNFDVPKTYILHIAPPEPWAEKTVQVVVT